MYLSIFVTCRLFTLKSSGAQMSITEHCFSSLSHIMMSGRLYFTLFTGVTGWFHHISCVEVWLTAGKGPLCFLGFSTFAISRTSSLAILSCLVVSYKLDDKDEQLPSTWKTVSSWSLHSLHVDSMLGSFIRRLIVAFVGISRNWPTVHTTIKSIRVHKLAT